MNLELDQEQLLLEESLTRFMEREYSFEQRKAIADSEAGWSRDIWHRFAELGWLGAGLPEENGGFGGGPIENMVIGKAFGSAMVLEPFVSTAVAGAHALSLADNTELAGELLPQVVDGGLVIALAHAERGARYDLEHQSTLARASGNAFVVNGSKLTVLDGHCADRFVVAARIHGDTRSATGIGLFIVNGSASGLSKEPFRTMDGSGAAHLQMSDCPAELLVGETRGLEVLEQVIGRAIAVRCAQAAGAMNTSLNQTVEYLKTREQFDVPIGSFQVIQHRLIDLLIAATECQAMAFMTAGKLAEPSLDRRERNRTASAAKSFVGKRANRAAQEIVQLHGGIGMTEEYSIGHYFRYLTQFCAAYGSTAHHLERYTNA